MLLVHEATLTFVRRESGTVSELARSGGGIYSDQHSLLPIRDIVLLVLYLFWQEGGAMENRRFHSNDRRQYMGMPKVPFKDSTGATINANRRRTSSRRLDFTDLIYLLENDIDPG